MQVIIDIYEFGRIQILDLHGHIKFAKEVKDNLPTEDLGQVKS